jgi:hypothetical protein
MVITHNGMGLVKIRGNISIDRRILNLGAREKYVVSFTHMSPFSYRATDASSY